MSGLEANLETGITGLQAEVTAEIRAFRKTMTHWMLTLLVAVIGAMAGIGFMS